MYVIALLYAETNTQDGHERGCGVRKMVWLNQCVCDNTKACSSS